MTTPEEDYNTAERLISRLEQLDRLRAPLHARYGAFGTFEHERKNVLAACRDSVRLAAESRLSNDTIDDLARKAPEYQAFIASAYSERTKLALIDAERMALGHRIENLKAYTYAAARLARLT